MRKGGARVARRSCRTAGMPGGLADARCTVADGVRATVAADRGYDTRDFVAQCRDRGVTPHVAKNESGRRSAIDGRTTRHPGYRMSLRARMLIEKIFGWVKGVGGLRRTRFKGRQRTQLAATLVAVAYNHLRMSRLLTSNG